MGLSEFEGRFLTELARLNNNLEDLHIVGSRLGEVEKLSSNLENLSNNLELSGGLNTFGPGLFANTFVRP